MSKLRHSLSVLIMVLSIIGNCLICRADKVLAETTTIPIDGRKYTFTEDSHYEISESTNYSVISSKKGKEGLLSISGDLTPLVEINGVPSFGVNGGNVSVSYTFGAVAKETAEDKWHIVEDNSKEVDGHKLSSSIGKMAAIVQTSLDGITWSYDKTLTNALNEEGMIKDLYKTKNIQLVSGSFYRVTLVYKTAKKIGEKKVLFVKTDILESNKTAEVFEFYLHDTKSSALISDTTVTMSLGSKQRTEKNEGYYGKKEIDLKDPHYSWDLGHFFVSGYTSDTTNKNGDPVFLKNVGDQVTLWFNLEQDIDKLHGNERLSINADESGYDRDFEIPKTNFGRGALIIRKTDYQKKISKPEIYTNYLEANATTNANTVVGLFEEGDYEVALDYEIKNTPRQVAGFDVIPEYSDYTIRFKFSIRNSNCMVFPFDLVTGEELIDNAITPNGFKLDLARSRYLIVNVQKNTISKGAKGYVLDTRFNRTAKDSDSFDEEGMYVFTVYNQFTGEKTTKTIYVGESSIIKALATSGMSLDEINSILANGGKIDKNGVVVQKK